MNMAISSNSVPSGKAAVASVNAASGAAQGKGFAGALVQAIEGGASGSNAGGTISLPAGVTGLLGQTQLASAGEQTKDLLALLAGLIDQLQGLEESEAPLTPETEDQLAAILASLEQLLAQLQTASQSAEGVTADAGANEPPAQSALFAEAANEVAKPIVTQVRETLQKLSDALATAKSIPEQIGGFLGQLKAALESAAPTLAPEARIESEQAEAAQKPQAKPDAKAEKALETGTAIPKESASQAAPAQENRRPAQAFRDPVWRFQVAATAGEASGANAQSAAAATNAAVESTGSAEPQPAWTFQQNDALAKQESAAVKTAPVPNPVPVQQFAEQMGKFLVKQFQLTQGNGTTEAKLKLTPEHLGQVDIRIVMQNGTVTAQFIADSPAAREMLENQMAQLRTALNGQGLQVDRLDVVQQPPTSAGTNFLHQDHRQSNSGSGNGSRGRNGSEGQEDAAVFAAELERNSSLKEAGFGSSINVTA